MDNSKYKKKDSELLTFQKLSLLPSYFMVLMFFGSVFSMFLPAITVWDYDGCDWYDGVITEKHTNEVLCVEEDLCYVEYSIIIIPHNPHQSNKTIYVSPFVYESLDIGEQYDFIAC